MKTKKFIKQLVNNPRKRISFWVGDQEYKVSDFIASDFDTVLYVELEHV